nr:ATP-grasp domain-containing protein [bacterium]
DSAAESKTAALLILQGLEARKDHPLYRTRGIDSPAIIAEEFVSGTEYSCDFIIENSSIKIIRLTRKIISSMSPFGTIMGYIIETVMPGDQGELESILHRGARALGISEAICMADFMVNDGRIMLLEITPRPGGDCLPMLLQHALGIDILSLTIEFARRQSITLNTHNSHPPAAGLRIIAAQGGILKHIDISELEKDNRARDIKILKHPGHLICMPPDDYDSWLLGHLVFHPDMDIDIKQQSNDLISKIKVNIKLCSSLTKTTS